MKLHTERDTLADAINWAAKALPTKPTTPVLACLLLTATDNNLTISGFDYETANQTTINAHIDHPGTVLISGRLLAEITKSLPNKPVEIETFGQQLALTCGSARFTLPTMPVEDYPTLPDLPETAGTIDATTFTRAVTQVAVAASRDPKVPMLTGVKLETTPTELTMFATDRYRGAIVSIPWTPTHPDHTINMLIPAATLTDIAKGLAGATGDITLSAAPNAHTEGGIIGISGNNRHTTSRLLDQNYPNLRALFPADHTITTTATINVANFIDVLKRVSTVTRGNNTPIRFGVDDVGASVMAGGNEDAQASEELECVFVGDPVTVGLKPEYLIDALVALGSSEATILFVDPKKPIVITAVQHHGDPDPTYRHLIMPMRIGG